MARIGALPPWWALVVLVVACLIGVRLARCRVDHLRPLALTGLLWLPWLPGPVPAAFMLWIWPLAGLVWIAAIAGVAAARWPNLMARAAAFGDHPRAPLIATLVAALAYASAAAAVSPRVPTGDEPHYLVITQSLLYDGDLRIENNHLRGDYLAYYGGGQLRPDYLRRGVDGEIYSVHPPGVSTLVLPAFALAGYAGVVVFLSLLMAAGGLAAWKAGALVTGDRRAAWVGWAAVMWTTPVVFHAFTVYPDGPGAVAVMVAALALVRMEVRGAAAVTRAELTAVGAVLAALPWLHTRFALIAGTLGLVILIRQWCMVDRAARIAAFFLVPVVSAAAWFGYFWAIYGTPHPAAPYGGYTQSSLTYALTGLPGLLLDQQFGLLASAPVYVAVLAGFVPLVRQRPRLAAELAVVMAPYLVAVGSYAMWWGGFSAPARFAVVILPVLAVPAAVAWQAWRGRATRALLLVSLALSILLVVTLSAVYAGEFLYEGRTGYATWLDWLNRTANLPLTAPSIHRDPVLIAILIAAAWGVALLAALGALTWMASRRMWPDGAWWTLTGAVVAIAVMLAATLSWAIEREPAVNRATSQAAFLERWDPAWLEVGVRLGPIEFFDADALPPRLRLRTTARHHESRGEAPLLAIPHVPAGEYDLLVAARGHLAGVLTVAVGVDERVLVHWPLDGRASPEPGWRLRLPVRVRSITIRGDDEARSRVEEVSLRPRAIAGGRWRSDYARRGDGYGTVQVFFLDDHAFPEGGGFWTRGRASTSVVVSPGGAARPVVRLHAGPVATPVELRVGAWTWRGTLAPRGSQEVALPSRAAGDDVRLAIITEDGFLPFEHEPDTADDRHLGVWVEFR